MKQAYLQYIAYHLPDDTLDNETLSAKYPEWSVAKIETKTNIKYRHICKQDETAGDLAFKASEKLFEEYDIDKEDIDYIILCTQSPDYFLPTTACLLQHRLGLSKRCGAFDFNLGCSGFVYGLGIAKGLIVSGQAANILFITSETYSKYIHPDDKSNRTIFGDAAAASLISATKMMEGLNAKINDFEYNTDGGGGDWLIVKNGGFRFPVKNGIDVVDENGNIRNDNNLFMDGKAIFNFTAFEVPKMIKAVLEKHNMMLSDIDVAVFHQANAYMLNVVRSRCNIPIEKFYINFQDVGNTVSSTIPIALKRAIIDKTLQKDQKALLAGFGVGLSMGATVLTT